MRFCLVLIYQSGTVFSICIRIFQLSLAHPHDYSDHNESLCGNSFPADSDQDLAIAFYWRNNLTGVVGPCINNSIYFGKKVTVTTLKSSNANQNTDYLCYTSKADMADPLTLTIPNGQNYKEFIYHTMTGKTEVTGERGCLYAECEVIAGVNAPIKGLVYLNSGEPEEHCFVSFEENSNIYIFPDEYDDSNGYEPYADFPAIINELVGEDKRSGINTVNPNLIERDIGGSISVKVSADTNNNQVQLSYIGTLPSNTQFIEGHVQIKYTGGVDCSETANRKTFINFKVYNEDTYTGQRPSISNAPISPTNCSISNKTINSLTINWIDNSTDESGFKIERREADSESFVQVKDIQPNSELKKLLSWPDAGLSSAIEYTYRVGAYYFGGNCSYSNYATETTSSNPPNIPSNCNLSDISSGQIKVNWTDSSTNEDEFKIEMQIGGYGEFNEIANIVSGSKTGTGSPLSYLKTGLSSSTPYSFRIRAYSNKDGDGAYSTPVSGTTLEGTSITITQVNLPNDNISFTTQNNENNINCIADIKPDVFDNHNSEIEWEIDDDPNTVGDSGNPDDSQTGVNVALVVAAPAASNGRGFKLNYRIRASVTINNILYTSVPTYIIQDEKDKLRQEYIDLSYDHFSMPTRNWLSLTGPTEYIDTTATAYWNEGIETMVSSIETQYEHYFRITSIGGSGFRCPIHNEATSEATPKKNSHHAYGRAADCHFNDENNNGSTIDEWYIINLHTPFKNGNIS